MNRREFTLSICVSALAILGALLLGVGRGDYLHVAVVAVAAPLSVYVTDAKRIFRLNRLLANLAALAAVAATTADYFRAESESRLLAIASMLVYLQIALFFQEKSRRIWWQIVLLSQLQVVVAAALTVSISFGLLLVVYTGLAVFILVVLLLEREIEQLAPQQTADQARSAPGGAATKRRPEAGGIRAASQPRASRASDRQPIVLVPADDVTHTPLADLAPWRISLLVAGISVLSGVVVFFVVPRTGRDPWQSSALPEQHFVGFSQQVRLGEIGDIAEDTSVVMRVKFLDPQTGKAIQLDAPPRLRGTVVTQYAQGMWSHHGRESNDEPERLAFPPLGGKFVLQEITLESLDEPVVFSVYPPFAVDRDLPVRYDGDREQLMREPASLTSSRLTVLIATNGIVGRAQLPLTWLSVPLTAGDRGRLIGRPRYRRRAVVLPAVQEIANRVVEEAGIGSSQRHLVCLALEEFLRQGGGFSYSLLARREDESLDPVEDFLLNTKTGHCEYFASALALMLRSQGIRARVVIGYQGGEWNTVGQFYTFRQRHTHSWVEAHLEKEDLLAMGEKPHEFGAWLRLDPTTSALAGAGNPTGMLASLKDATDYAELVWSKYVVGLSRNRQRAVLFAPLGDQIRLLFDPHTLWVELKGIPQRAIAGIRTWVGGNWVSWRGGLLAMAVALLVVGSYRGAVLAGRLVQRRKTGRGGRRLRSGMPLYRRFEQVLRRHGIRRRVDQTPLELANDLGQLLASAATADEVAAAPRRVVDAFYRVRFGDRFVTPAQHRELASAISQLDQALQRLAPLEMGRS